MARMHLLLCKAASLLLAFTVCAAAQDYPAKPVRIVVPFPPGAVNDLVGRLLATELSERFGKQFIVENRAGAGGVTGAEHVANAPKDGYTFLIVSQATAVNPWLRKMPYDPARAFTPVAIVLTTPNSVVLNPSVPVKSIKELIALAKSKPGELQYASSGVGTFLHLGAELFKTMAGVDILHVPFKGAAPAMIDVIGGHTQLAFASATTAMPHIRSGKLKVLAVGGRQRSPTLPDVPTVAEAGVTGYEAANWVGLVAPAGTPPEIVARLHKEISEIQNMPKVQEQIRNAGGELMRMSVAEFGAFQASELAKWGKVVKEAGIKPQ